MKYFFSSFYFLFLSGQLAFSQCPQITVSVADTLCEGLPATISNTSNASTFAWDFCPGDLRTTPSGTNFGNPGGLSFPNQATVVNDNGDYYAFIANFGTGTIGRMNFGNSLNNTPTVFNYTGFVFPIGIDIVREGSSWVGLVVDYGTNKLLRINLGTAISSNTISITDLGTFGFNAPRNVKIAVDNGNYYAFVTNEGGNSIHHFSFGNSLSNTPTVTTFSHSSFSFTWGFDIEYNCSTGEFIGFTSSYNTGQISVINFGNTLANAGTVTHTYFSPNGAPSTLDLAYDVDGWHLFVLSNSGSAMQQLYLGNNLLNTAPTVVFNSNVGALNAPRGLSMMKEGSVWYAVISNQGDNSLSVLKYEKNCNAVPAFSNQQNPPAVSFNGSQWQPFLLGAYSSSGILAYYSDSIYFAPSPTASFSFLSACLNLPVAFTDQSSVPAGTLAAWLWNFGDGSPVSTIQNPVHTYTSLGTYTVSLNVTSDAGCTDSISQSITVNELPQSNFSFPNNQCRGALVPFTDLSTAPSNNVITAWEWNFGDGSPVSNLQNPTHSFINQGTYTVQLIAYTNNNCPDTSSQVITIVPGPLTDFSFTSTCAGSAVVFSNSSTLQGGGTLTFEWNFGDGNQSTLENPVHAYPPVAANYQVQLISTSPNGCKDTLELPIRISNKANPSFTISPSVACINSPIQFTSTSTVSAGDSIISISWNFGDSPLIFSGNPVTHQYVNPGTYPVTLTVKTYSDCDTSLTIPVTVIESPVANFTFQNVCLDSAVTFINQSTTPPGTTIDSIHWNFGDGNSANGPVVSHVYSSPGTYSVALTVFNNAGCSNTIQKQVTIHPRPFASWVNSYPCSGSPISFFNTSTIATGSIAASFWNFGDNSTSSLNSPQHTYSTGGLYNITLIVYSDFGCTDTFSSPITVNQSPVFDFTVSQTCLGKPTQFTYVNLNPGQPDSAFFWNWNFGDGTPTSNIPSPTHNYSQSGVYQVVLTGTAINTCSRIVTKSVSINPVPQVNFSTANFICKGTPSQFTNQTTLSSGTISQYIWNFGDGSPLSFVTNPVHTYTSVSTFTAKLIAISDSGCVDSLSKQISVAPLPVISFTVNPDYGSPPLTVTIQNTTPGSNTFLWNFGDGSLPVSGVNPTHVYTDTGTFTITVVATNASGCSDSLSKTVDVVDPFTDLALTDVNAVSSNNTLQLFALVSNKGNVMINQFELKAHTNQHSAIIETWQGTQPIKPGDNLLIPLASKFVVTQGYEPEFYCIEILTVNGQPDAVDSNDRLCRNLKQDFGTIFIYPNPTQDNVTIAFTLPAAGKYELCIYDMAGRKVRCMSEVESTAGYNELNLSVAGLSKGMYAVAVRFNDDVRTGRIIKY